MAKAATINSISTGHPPSFPPRLPISASTNVFINGQGALRSGDTYAVHCDTNGNCHPGTVQASGDVYVNGQVLAYGGAPISCGDTVAQGSNDVNVG